MRPPPLQSPARRLPALPPSGGPHVVWVPDGVLVLGQSRGMVSTSALCLRFKHPGRRLDMLIWEACALRHSCRHLLAKGGFRLCQEPCIIVLYTYIIYFPRRVRVRGARVILREGSSTSGADKTRTKRSLRVKRASSGTSPPPPTCSLQTGQCSGTWSRPVAVSRPCQQDQAAKRSNRRESPSSVWSRHSGAAWRVLTKLRVNLGLTIATMAE